MNKPIWYAAMLSLALLLGAGCAATETEYRPLGEPPTSRGN